MFLVSLRTLSPQGLSSAPMKDIDRSEVEKGLYLAFKNS